MANKKLYILPVAWMAVIFILSSISYEPDPAAPRDIVKETIRNLLHIPLFGFLAFLWVKAFSKNGVALNRAMLYTAVIVIFYSAFDELHQSFVPGRYATVGDFLLNTLGMALALIFVKRKHDTA